MPETCTDSWQNKILDTWCILLVIYTNIKIHFNIILPMRLSSQTFVPFRLTSKILYAFLTSPTTLQNHLSFCIGNRFEIAWQFINQKLNKGLWTIFQTRGNKLAEVPLAVWRFDCHTRARATRCNVIQHFYTHRGFQRWSFEVVIIVNGLKKPWRIPHRVQLLLLCTLPQFTN